MTHAPDADLLIAGGGNTGAALALAAASAGLSVILIDPEPVARRAAPDFDGRAYALAAASVRMLTALGVWPAVAAEAEAMRAIEILDGRLGDPGPVRLRFEAEDLDSAPFAVLLEDRFLRGALLDAVAAEPRITHLSPARVVDHEAGPAGAVATLDDGRRLSAGVIAACDGKRSLTAARAGVTWARGRYDQIGLVCAVACETPHAGVARQVFYPGGPFAMLPLPGDRVSIVWSERVREARRIAALDDRGYAAEIALRAGGLLGRVALAGRRWAYPLDFSLAYSFVGPRLAVVGDAAHGFHPIAGQGFNLALRDAAALAETLAEARRRGEDIGAPAVLERYQQWRRFDSTAYGAATDGLNRLFSSDFAPLRALRDAGLGAVSRLPALKRAFMASAAGASGAAPRLLRGERP
ncbi:MAG: 2-octaprenyl-6-methoxyphenyl hydroxylase [Rhodobacteraceae bacterium]|nr:MAG: 2-octaprenyl-6-methoxyphenyl hydroxylase [Paracoccaceae bacterium]